MLELFYFALFEGEDLGAPSIVSGDTLCVARSLPQLTGMLYEDSWADYTSYLLARSTGGPPMACAVEYSTGFVKTTWQQAPRSRTLSKEKPKRFSSPLLWGLHATPGLVVDRTRTVPTDLTFTSAPVGSRWFALEDTGRFHDRRCHHH